MTIKEHQMTFNKNLVFLAMNSFVVFIIMIFVSCQKPLIEVNEDLLKLDPQKGLVFYKDKPFTGTSIKYYSNGKKEIAIDYFLGKKQGIYKKWFDDGTLSFESHYAKGKKNGVTKTWWRNGNLRSELYSEHGASNGQQKQWYKSGAKFKVINLANGKEEGLQQSWRENGKIYNNYEAKDGKIFGLKRASLCYELDDEIIQYKTD